MAKITDTTALNVLFNNAAQGADESHFYHSKVYNPRDVIRNLVRKGYKIQTRLITGSNNQQDTCWFLNVEHAKALAVERKAASLASQPRSS